MSATADEPEYGVEKILDKRFDEKTRRPLYLIKWEGYGMEECTWEPKENVTGCADLLADFEKEHRKKQKLAHRHNSSKRGKKRKLPSPPVSDADEEVEEENGPSPDANDAGAAGNNNPSGSNGMAAESSDDDRSSSKSEPNAEANIDVDNVVDEFEHEPEEIVGATDQSGELMYLMQWRNIREADLVLAETAERICPQVVIQFFKKRLIWADPISDTE